MFSGGMSTDSVTIVGVVSPAVGVRRCGESVVVDMVVPVCLAQNYQKRHPENQSRDTNLINHQQVKPDGKQ